MKRWQAAVLAAMTACLLVGCRAAATPGATPTTAATAAPTEAPTPTPVPMNNPLTGGEGDYTGQRPVAVQMQTAESATPFWGVSTADVVVEGVTEGKYATLMAIYPSADVISKAGAVGSGRDMMLQFALPLNAVPVHIDKNQYADNLLNTLAYQDLDGYHIGKAAFAFDLDRKNSGHFEETCWYTTTELIRAGLENYGASTEGETIRLFQFGERPAPAARNAVELSVTFSDKDTEGLVYSPDTGLYLKNNPDGSPMVDADSGDQAAFTNVFVLYASSGVKDDKITRQYDLSGGTGLYLNQGGWQEIRWQKGDATAPLTVTDTAGTTLTVAPGKSYIAIYGGYYSQSLRLVGEDGAEQALPAKPALMDSGIPDDVAASAQEAYDAQQNYVAESEAALSAAASDSAAAEAAGESPPAEATPAPEGEVPAETQAQ